MTKKGFDFYRVMAIIYFLFGFAFLLVFLYKVYIPSVDNPTIWTVLIAVGYAQVMFYAWLKEEHLNTRSQLCSIEKRLKEIQHGRSEKES